jgi:predicted RND superfamily exporter protein
LTPPESPRYKVAMFRAMAARRPAAVAAVAGLTALAAVPVARLDVDTDLLSTLPDDHEQVRVLRELGRKFGVLTTAVIGAIAEGDLFSAPALGALRSLSRAAAAMPGVVHVHSITEVPDVEATVEGSTIAPLIGSIPRDPAALRALKAKVLTREGVVGSLISERGDAALVIVQIGGTADSGRVASALRVEALRRAGPLRLFFGGAPFIADFTRRESLQGVAIAAPVAAVALVAILLLSGRGSGRLGRVLVPLATGVFASVWTLALAALAASPLPAITLSGLCVPLVVGLCVAALVSRRGLREGGADAARGAGVAAAALFALAPLSELRGFALIGGVGAILALFAAVLVEMIRGEPRPPLPRPWPGSGRALRFALGALCAALTAAAAIGAVHVRADPSGMSAFSERAEPRLARDFLARHFRLEDVVFVRARGDLRDPGSVRYIERLAEEIGAIPGVSAVHNITVPLRLVHKTLTGRREIPEVRERLAQLWNLLDGNREVTTLVDDARSEALLHVQIAAGNPSDVREVALRVRGAVERLRTVEVAQVRAGESSEFSALLAADMARRASAVAVRYGLKRPEGLRDRLEAFLKQTTPERIAAATRSAVADYFRSDEALVSLGAPGEPESALRARAERLGTRLAGIVLSGWRPGEVAGLLRAELPHEAARDAAVLEKAAPMILERARAATREELARRLTEEVGAPLWARLGPARQQRLSEELRTVFYGALDRTVVVPRRPGARNPQRVTATLHLSATSAALAVESAMHGLHAALTWGALLALAAATAVALAALRSWRGAAAGLPLLLGAGTAYGALGLIGSPTDPSLAVLLPLTVGAGAFAGYLSLAGPFPRGVTAPLFAAAAMFAALATAGFTPMQRFGSLSALALAASAAGAAWLSAMTFRRERKQQ